MDIPIVEIHFPLDLRLRQDYGNLDTLESDLRANGQLQDILVKPLYKKEFPDIEKSWVIVDGGRRFLCFTEIYKEGDEVKEVEPGCIGAKIRDIDDPLYSVLLEYQANAVRKDFNWRERAVFIDKLHAGFKERYDKWTVIGTATAIHMTEQTIYKYLQLIKPAYFNLPEIAEADSFRTAYKKYQIIKDKARRKAEAEGIQVTPSPAQLRESGEEVFSVPKVLVDKHLFKNLEMDLVQADARDWIKTIKSGSLAWFHWDPPYGGEQGGGRDPLHGDVQDDEEHAWELIRAVIPEIHRVLKDGSWLAIWYNPKFYSRLVALLQGHSFEGGKCKTCGRTLDELHTLYQCHKKVKVRFWTNPYPYAWYKENRVSDGHEITRFSVNSYETFLLACKNEELDPILVNSGTQNIMPHPIVPHAIRQHPMQKPVEVLRWILDMISVPKTRGGDASMGSGTIAEAAFSTWRTLMGCEIDEGFRNIAVENAARGLIQRPDLAQDEKREEEE